MVPTAAAGLHPKPPRTEPTVREPGDIQLPNGPLQGAHLLDLLPSEVPFTTSGTTGPPVTWLRTRQQLVVEALLLIDLLELEGTDLVLTYAPTRHLYGFLFGRMVPALLGAPVHHVALDEPLPATTAARPLVVTLPAAWWHLDRSVPLPGGGRFTAVHSSARLPDAAARFCSRPDVRVRLHELHGSTETGVVGHRIHGARDSSWRLVPDTHIVDALSPHVECRLRVRSLRLARRAGENRRFSFDLKDIVVRGADPARYRLLGRAGRLVKVNGRRIDLAAVESRLREGLPGAEIRCVPVSDQVRSEWFDAQIVGGSQERETLLRACRDLLKPEEMPRTVRAVPETAPGAEVGKPA